ncbi:hypothetical protein D9619_003905 [Psilocybe cf. subviscida]|uniref:Uncharacterized protein n=1 Tax=Psilocybe cf. subviscida TaxID=2480587 RepID=A0A8H5F8S6_9AGAR|nr:hypothetical protein D9619_003905 [Psilocybe cf. subviscida]
MQLPPRRRHAVTHGTVSATTLDNNRLSREPRATNDDNSPLQRNNILGENLARMCKLGRTERILTYVGMGAALRSSHSLTPGPQSSSTFILSSGPNTTAICGAHS